MKGFAVSMRKKVFTSFVALALIISFTPFAQAQENVELFQQTEESGIQKLAQEEHSTEGDLSTDEEELLVDEENAEEVKDDAIGGDVLDGKNDLGLIPNEASAFSLMDTREAGTQEESIDLEGSFIVVDSNNEPLYGGNDIAEAFSVISLSAGSHYTLIAQASTTLEQPLSIPSGKSVVITSGEERTATLTASGSGQRHFQVGGTLELENIVLDGATVGGGIEFFGSNLTLRAGVVIENCYTENHGGGIFAKSGSSVVLQSGSIVRNNVASANVQNLAGSDYGRGGGIYSAAGSLVVESGAEVSGNTALYGGGIYANQSVSIAGSILNNNAYRTGGGAYCVHSGNQVVSLDGATISGNVAYAYGAPLENPSATSGAAGGGGVCLWLGPSTKAISVSGATITNNHALTESNPSINGGVDYLTVNRPTGGGIWINNSNGSDAKLVIENSTISNNSASNGGALSLRCYTEITNTVFSNNHVASKTYNDIFTQGGAMYLNAARGGNGDTYTITLVGGSISGCTSSYSAAGIGFTNGKEKQLSVDGTAFYDNSIGTYAYEWDLDNPTGFEGSYVSQYEDRILNVTQVTEPYTNIYNNVDVGFGLLRLVQYSANGGLFDHEEVNAEFGGQYFGEDFERLGLRFNPGSKLSTLTSEPFKEDDEFLGWYLADFTTQVEPGTRVLENYVFYALWKSQMRTVAYDANTEDSVSGMPDSAQIVQGNECVVSDAIPERDHYTFVGWNAQADGSGDIYTAEDSFAVEDHLTLYAQWERQIATVTYHPSTEDEVLNMPVGTEVPYGETYTVSSLIPELEGFDFLGWNTEADLTGDTHLPGATLTVTGHITLHAEWDIESRLGEFSVWYQPNGATSGTAPVDELGYEQGETATILGEGDLELTGKVFAGWNTEADGTGGKYAEGDIAVMTETLTLYAQWEDDPLGDKSGPQDPDNPDDPNDPLVGNQSDRNGQGTAGASGQSGFSGYAGGGSILPQSGDEMPFFAFAGVAVVALLILAGILVWGSRKKD